LRFNQCRRVHSYASDAFKSLTTAECLAIVEIRRAVLRAFGVIPEFLD